MQASKKGFTLIELLAVIVILAIILLIATPIILNIIEDVKEGAAQSSAKFYVKAVEQELLIKSMKEDGFVVPATIDDPEFTTVTDYPNDVALIIEDGKVSGDVTYGDYTMTFANGKLTNTAKAEAGTGD